MKYVLPPSFLVNHITIWMIYYDKYYRWGFSATPILPSEPAAGPDVDPAQGGHPEVLCAPQPGMLPAA